MIVPDRIASRRGFTAMGRRSVLPFDKHDNLKSFYQATYSDAQSLFKEMSRRPMLMINAKDWANNTIDYSCVVAVDEGAEVMQSLEVSKIPDQIYAVYKHNGPVSELGVFWEEIVESWNSNDEMKIADSPELQVFCDDFDLESDIGSVEVWIPVEARSGGH